MGNRPLAFLFLGLVLFLAILWGSRPLIHDDLFFHLATGQYVVEHYEVPTTDLFSFTRQGEPWVSHEWGFGVLAHFFWLAGGDWALVALKATAVVAILLALLALMIRRSGARFAAPPAGLVALLAVSLWAINDQLILRASLFSSLFVLILLGLLHWFDQRGSRLSAVAIALLFLLWGNFHGEVIFGLFVLGVVTAEAVGGRMRTRGPLPGTLFQANPERPYLRLFLVSFVLTLVNPNGVQVLLYPFRLAAFLFTKGDSLKMGHFGGATPASFAGFFLLIAILLLGLLPLERLKILSLTEVVTVGTFLVLSLRSHRFILFFVLFALPVIARQFGQSHRQGKPLVKSPVLRSLVLGVTALTVAAAAAAAWQSHERIPVSRHFPAGAVELLQDEEVEGRLFNHQNYGGYLRWKLDEPIFWDGRNLLFASLMEEVAQMPLEQVAEKWGVDHVLLTDFEYLQMGDQLLPETWGLVYWDDFVAIYLRRGGGFDPVLEGSEMRLLPPFGGVEGLNILAQDATQVAAARRELDHVLRFEPGCQRALYLHGLISFYEGDSERAESELRWALALGPKPHVYDALARVLDSLGRQQEALELRRRAIDAE